MSQYKQCDEILLLRKLEYTNNSLSLTLSLQAKVIHGVK
jgi:hypothetical protein